MVNFHEGLEYLKSRRCSRVFHVKQSMKTKVMFHVKTFRQTAYIQPFNSDLEAFLFWWKEERC